MAEIVIIDRVEDDSYNGKDHKKVTDKSGRTFNVKYGREGDELASSALAEIGNPVYPGNLQFPGLFYHFPQAQENDGRRGRIE